MSGNALQNNSSIFFLNFPRERTTEKEKNIHHIIDTSHVFFLSVLPSAFRMFYSTSIIQPNLSSSSPACTPRTLSYKAWHTGPVSSDPPLMLTICHIARTQTKWGWTESVKGVEEGGHESDAIRRMARGVGNLNTSGAAESERGKPTPRDQYQYQFHHYHHRQQ